MCLVSNDIIKRLHFGFVMALNIDNFCKKQNRIFKSAIMIMMII